MILRRNVIVNVKTYRFNVSTLYLKIGVYIWAIYTIILLCYVLNTKLRYISCAQTLRNSVISDLKTGIKKGLNADTLSKIADYFNVSVDYLIGKSNQKENAPATSRSVSDDDIMFALFNGSDGITDEMYEEVKRFAQFIKERESGKR